MINYARIEELGELAVIVPIHKAYRVTRIDPRGYFDVSAYKRYCGETGDYIVCQMKEFDYVFDGYSPLDVAEKLEKTSWFSTDDEYFICEDFGGIRSLAQDEFKDHYEENIDMLDFIKWAHDVELGGTLFDYLEDVKRDLARKLEVDTIIIEF